MMMTKILVVDDEPDIEPLIKQKFSKYVKSKELEFIFASNGFEALKVLHQDQDINIILTDINMPEMDGLALLSHLPEFKRIFKPIIISAYGDMLNIRKAMNRGACDFITKPIDFKDLEITLFNAIEQYITLKRAVEAQSLLSDLEKELMIARGIQQSIIPHNFKPFPKVDTFEILGTMIPARQVGGDFFDFFPLDDKRLGFIIGDVSGKGVPAALFMAMSRSIIRTIAQKGLSAKDCLIESNQVLCTDNESCMFVTAFYGILNIETGHIECANAGHPPPYLLRENKTIERIARNEGVPLGVGGESIYTNLEITLKKDDCLILYTDGVSEAMNEKKELYGESRLEASLANWKIGPLSTLMSQILNDLHKFNSSYYDNDDITLLCIRQLV